MDDKEVKDWQSETKAQLMRDIAAAQSNQNKDDLRIEKLQVINQLAAVRLDKRLSQVKLAERAGMPQPALARIESGAANPSLKTLLRIAKALGVRLVLE